MRFKLLYIIFIVICILYPSKYIVGPISFRHIISVIMLAACIWEGFRSDKYLYLYYGFVFFLGISSIATGFAGTFFNRLLGSYLPMVTAYAATYLLIKKKEGTNVIIWTFVFIGILNALVTIGQFFNWGIIDDLFSFLRFEIDDNFTTISELKDAEGLTLPGLMGNVNNGFFLSATALLILYNRQCNFYFNILLWLVVMAASFLAQERAGFMLACAFSAFIVGNHYFSKNTTLGFFAVVIMLIVSAYLINFYMEEVLSSELRYAKGLEGDSRSEYRSVTWNYILNNPMGGFYEFNSNGNNHPHNYFLNAFLFGGFFGGIFVILLLILQVIKIIPFLFRNKETEESKWAFIWGLIYIDYTLNSLVHNASIVQGIMPFFIWWGAFLAYAELHEEEQNEIIDIHA